MAQHTFEVEHIHCGACETAIRKSLSRLDGVRQVEPDSATNRVTVIYDEKAVTEQLLAQRLDAAGYPLRS